ncbi:MAG: hypothetical protein EOO39_27810, partial [Cytophagaceae bacterium]
MVLFFCGVYLATNQSTACIFSALLACIQVCLQMAVKRYKANRKGGFKYLILALILLGSAIVASEPATFATRPFLLLPLMSPTGLLLWIYVDTYYQLEHTTLRYKSGFVSGQIDVRRIRQVHVGTTQWMGFKPALAGGGLVITYNRFDEIYLAPVNNQEL